MFENIYKIINYHYQIAISSLEMSSMSIKAMNEALAPVNQHTPNCSCIGRFKLINNTVLPERVIVQTHLNYLADRVPLRC